MGNDAMIKINCVALTPIWTGDPKGQGGQILETGILGSMRWWYEMALRGLDIFACDPTSESGCKLDGIAYKTSPEQSLKNLCPACLLFGCTGWKRRFLLRVEYTNFCDYKIQSLGGPSHSNVEWQKKILKMEQGEYKLPIGPFTLTIQPHIQPHKNWKTDVQNQLEALLSIMSQMGGIGAKTQNGFGQFMIDDPNPNLTLDNAKNMIQGFAMHQNYDTKKNAAEGDSLNQYWGYEVSDIDVVRPGMKSIKPIKFQKNEASYHCYPVAFDLRTSVKIDKEPKGIRFKYKKDLIAAHDCKNKGNYGKHNTCKACNQQVETLFGNLHHGGKIFVSHPFKPADQEKATLRIWGLTTKKEKEALDPVITNQMSSIFGSDKIDTIQNPFSNLGDISDV